MKRSSKILAILLSVCLIFGVVFALVASAATVLVQNPTPDGAVSGGFLDFDTDTDTKKYDTYKNTWTSSMPGSQARMYVGSNWLSVHTNLLKTQTVDGRTNKYLDVTRDKFGTYSSTAFFGTAPNTLAYPNEDKVLNDFYIFDIDLMANYYQYEDYENVYTLADYVIMKDGKKVYEIGNAYLVSNCNDALFFLQGNYMYAVGKDGEVYIKALHTFLNND